MVFEIPPRKSSNLLHENIFEDLRISARKNGLGISKSKLNKITKRDLKWHPYKMHVRKERMVNEVDLVKENQDLLKSVMAGMRRSYIGCKSAFKEMEDISKEMEISRVH